MQIYIPTLGRVNFQRTYGYIPKNWVKRTTLVCPVDEVEYHKDLGRNAIGCPLHGIHNVRQFIVDNSPDEHVLMIDDDHHFYIRKSPAAWNMCYMKQDDVDGLLCSIQTYMEMGEVFVGVSSRQGNNNMFPDLIRRNMRNCNMYAVNTTILKNNSIRFDAQPLMEDFYVQLRLLTRGYSTLTITDRAWGQVASNMNGGCSSYRNKELQEKAAMMLYEAFPDYVKLVTKKNVSGWEGMEGRTDVIIQWKKAYEEGCRVRNQSA